MRVTKAFALFSLFLSTLVVIGWGLKPAWAEGSEITLATQKINPGNKFFIHKRLLEKVEDFLAFSKERKVRLHRRLLLARVSELKYVSENKLLSEMEKASQRVSYEAGVVEQAAQGLNDETVKKDAAELFSTLGEFLPQLRDRYKANSSDWLLIQQNIDTLQMLSEKLS